MPSSGMPRKEPRLCTACQRDGRVEPPSQAGELAGGSSRAAQGLLVRAHRSFSGLIVQQPVPTAVGTFLISSLNERDIGFPAHSRQLGVEKSAGWAALDIVAVRNGCMGNSKSKHLPQTFCGLCTSVCVSPHNQCASMRAFGSVPESGWSNALLLQQRWQKSWPHWRQWWRRHMRLNSLPHRMQLGAASSGSQSARPRVLGGSGGPVYTYAPGGMSSRPLGGAGRPAGCGEPDCSSGAGAAACSTGAGAAGLGGSGMMLGPVFMIDMLAVPKKTS